MTDVLINNTREVINITASNGPVLQVSVSRPVVSLSTVGIQGPSGGGSASISTDAGNQIVLGSDLGIYVADPETDTITAGEALGGLRLVTAAGLYLTQATLHLALGLTLNAAALNASVKVLLSGRYTDAGWTWTPGQPLFLGASAVMTHTPPTTGNTRRFGYALTATTIYFDLSPVITRA